MTLARVAARVAARSRGESGHYAWHDPRRAYLSLEQPPSVTNRPRWGHGQPPQRDLAAILARGNESYAQQLEMITEFGDGLAAIPREDRGGTDPAWANPMTKGLDGASIYGFIRRRQPRTYLEVGSGYSTKFAARAKADGSAHTRIESIDPKPRAEIDALCDEVIRTRLEAVDLSVFERLRPGDIVFFDGSHRVFMDNDVTTFFIDVLPRIPPDVLVGIHDIYIPEDYFPDHAEMYWTEQYMLAMAVLAGGVEIVLPCHYVAITPELRRALTQRWEAIGLGDVNAYGNAFWIHPRLQSGAGARSG